MSAERPRPNLKHGIDGVYWNGDDTEDKFPYCPLCLEKDEKNIHLTSTERSPGFVWYCKSCGEEWKQTKWI